MKIKVLASVFVALLAANVGAAFLVRTSRHEVKKSSKRLHPLTCLEALVPVTDTSPPDVVARRGRGVRGSWGDVFSANTLIENASVCVVGGGVSGLTAAITAAELGADVILLEASENLGGRVQSDPTADGFLLDRGFAVFIEQYPSARKLLDYRELRLGKFLPGALVKLAGERKLARVSDPLRVPSDLFTALSAPVGTFADKLKVLPLILHTRINSIDALFREPETDTLTALKRRWGFSDDMVEKFFKPFLEGIYLAPLHEQSSHMFHFVFKMFSEGSATLPLGGMQAVTDQLERKALRAGVKIRRGHPVSLISRLDGGGFAVKTAVGKLSTIEADSVIIATDGRIAQRLLSLVEGLDQVASSMSTNAQRVVGCLYYTFEGSAPVKDPLLILNGIGRARGNLGNPVNNCCFPSVVNEGYAPKGAQLCCVTVLKDAMEAYKGREDELDLAVRRQLGTWFPDYKGDILYRWELRNIYYIPNAQPSQLGGPLPASAHGGRDCSEYCGQKLPPGLFVCGDHMATATLNGALESGVKAGKRAASVPATLIRF